MVNNNPVSYLLLYLIIEPYAV
uniref:Uncharacterized protein n=1 Tax=Anguilla anguilla TaxID=7936 RepID=A0A0E9VKN0_ANGAN